MNKPSIRKQIVAGLRRCLVLLLIIFVTPLQAEDKRVSISLEDVEIQKVMRMLSKQQRLNIFVGEGVEGRVSINLYDMEVVHAIKSISDAAGYAVEERNGSYFIVERDEVGKYNHSGLTEVRSFKIQYTQPSQVKSILKDYLSSFGKITTLNDRGLLIVEDQPGYIDQIEALLSEIDREPKQILIEAKILEVTLTDSESFGLDWSKLFNTSAGSGSFGIRNLSSVTNPGLFFQYLSPNIEIALNALKERGRLRTLSTPKLLAMEDRTAETVVGTRLGFRVTTTINQVTSESIEFLETGIILKVTPSVDRQGKILLDIHPEVSDGSVSDDGIPSKTTTQLSTRMLVPDGQTVFLGGLIKHNTNESREGVPMLGDLPGVGLLFSNRSKNLTATEIVVLITPKVVDLQAGDWNEDNVVKTERMERLLGDAKARAEARMQHVMNGKLPAEPISGEPQPGSGDSPWILDFDD
ncbi:MAG: secretin N-terminal domain-containing protein [Gammaproteobacteria bacterium]|nr:secretin N-terminal domain-containing protein [Gammaproteobacteria bacterium]